jgi:hypothetical protein
VYERICVLVAGDVDERAGTAAARGRHDVGEFHRGRDALARVVHGREPIEPVIRDARDADVDVPFGSGSVSNAGHQLKEGGLAGRGEPDDGGVKHRNEPNRKWGRESFVEDSSSECREATFT